MPIRHTTVATFADEVGAEINKAEWNADHTNPDIADVTGLQSAIDAKQDALVSGTNIKTINGASVLGSGNLVVGGVSDGDKGDITVSSGGTVWTIDDFVITLAKQSTSLRNYNIAMAVAL